MKSNTKRVVAFILTVFATWTIEKILDRTGIYDKISILFTSNDYSVLNVFNRTYPLWSIVIMFIVFVGTFYLFSKMLRLGRVSRRESRLIEIAKKYENYKFNNDSLLLKSKFSFNENETPVFKSCQVFCNLHEFPVRMSISGHYFNCNFPNCTLSIFHNSISQNSPINQMQELILSSIIAEIELSEIK